jgi:TPR repeat protein
MILRKIKNGYWRGVIAGFCLLVPITVSAQSVPELLDIAQTAYDEQEFDAAFEIWTPLADGGNIDAQMAMADAALNCSCDLKDGTNIAFKYYRMAAEKGNARALRQMGYIARYIGTDKVEAALYYKAAADKGDVESQIELGDLYSEGVGGEATLPESVKYYLMAAAQGDGRGYARMARLYADGGPTKVDVSKAYIAQSIAATLSFPMAKEKLPDAAKKLSAKQLVEADILVANCVKAQYLNCL